MGYFWTNTVWFLLLGTTIIIELVYIIIRAKNRWLTFVFYLSVSGFTYLLETTIFGIFKSYEYYPMIFNNVSRLDDGLAGNIFSQFSISATALLISSRKLRFYWYFIFALLYGGIEELFLYLGIYTHNWYRTWMTVATLIILFPLIKKAYDTVFNKPRRLIKYFLIVFAAFVPHTILITWPFKLLGYPAFNDRIVADPDVSAMIMFAANFTLLVNIITAALFFRIKWWQHAGVAAALFALYYVAYIFGVIIYQSIGMVALFAVVEIGGMYLSVFIMEKLYASAPGNKHGTLPIEECVLK